MKFSFQVTVCDRGLGECDSACVCLNVGTISRISVFRVVHSSQSLDSWTIYHAVSPRPVMETCAEMLAPALAKAMRLESAQAREQAAAAAHGLLGDAPRAMKQCTSLSEAATEVRQFMSPAGAFRLSNFCSTVENSKLEPT